jgi:intracellular sulfur oxidation DsrE/DsrF family protein
MSTTRREFLDRIALGAAATGAAALAGLPLPLGAMAAPTSAADWDVRWPARLTGKRRTVLDVPEVENGYGVWRASIWAQQYQQVLGVQPREMSTVLVLRHNGIVLALQQPFWDEHGLGKLKSVMHPVTQQPTDRNPALMSSAHGDVPADFDGFALDKLLARGAVVLACDLALQDVAQHVQQRAGVTADEAKRRTHAALVPGVIVQPSGVFAVVRAQEAGCMYVRAS